MNYLIKFLSKVSVFHINQGIFYQNMSIFPLKKENYESKSGQKLVNNFDWHCASIK